MLNKPMVTKIFSLSSDLNETITKKQDKILAYNNTSFFKVNRACYPNKILFRKERKKEPTY